MEDKRAELNTNQPSPEEMVQLLSQTVIQQNNEITELKKVNEHLKEDLNKAMKELSMPTKAPDKEMKSVIILDYLDSELRYAKLKVKELRNHIAEYPEDNYAQTDLQNCLLHINYLYAMIRRLGV